MTRDLEKLLDKASPNLPAKIQDTKLYYHLINLPERIALQLKLPPKANFVETISKARELCLIYNSTNTTESVNPISHTEEDTCLNKMEATLQDVSEQLLAFNTQHQEPLQCFNCGKLGCVTRLCRGERAPPVTVTCFKYGNRGYLAHNCRNQQQPR